MELIEPILSAFHARPRARTLAAAALCLALLATACEKKTVKAVPPVLAPSIESEPQPAPPMQPTPAATPTPAPVPASPTTPPETEVQKPRHKPRRTIVRAPREPRPEPPKPEAAKPQPPAPPKPAAPDSSMQITAAAPRAAVQSQTESTEQLLRTSEMKLAGLNRSLNQSEQAMATQARNYIAQSHQAIQEGEIERAYNLAVKASLLADELAK
jgi:outer membrane biosynthesis protein TonB